MDDPVQTTPVDDEPLCVCGYSKVGLPEIDHPARSAVQPNWPCTSLRIRTTWNVACWGLAFLLLKL